LLFRPKLMPIEFRCPHCQQLLRVPDATAGKQARCPQCGQISPVPAPEGPVAHARQAYSPVNPFSEASAPTQQPFSGEAFNPYAAPAPQEKVIAATGGGALTHHILDMGEVLSSTWRVLNNDLGQCALVGLVYLAVVIGMSVVGGMTGGIIQAAAGDAIGAIIAAQVINQTLSFVVQTWVWLGMAAWGVKMLRTRRAGVNELFSVGPYYLRGLGGGLLIYLMILGAMAVLVGIPVLVGWSMNSQETMAIGGIVGAVLWAGVALYVFYTYFLYTFFIVDRNASITEAFRLSREFTQGNRLSIFAVTLLVGIAGAVFSLCTCYLGLIVYIPYMMLVFAMMYLMATGQTHADQPAPLKQI
jgi:hypothetical protein